LFRAEDGIRDRNVTGVQTCALPICGQSQAKEKTLTIGLVAPTDKDTHVWDAVKKEAKDNYGLTIKLKEFSDWNQPNKAVANGELDANSFQTKERSEEHTSELQSRFDL